MATINGTSGNDILTTNLFTDDDFFGFAGDDIFEYELDGGNDTITDSNGDDELKFGSGINRYTLAFLRVGNDLVVSTTEAGSITIKNHFVSSSDQVETLTFDAGPAIDLSIGNILFQEKDSYGLYATLYGTSGDDVMYGGISEADFPYYYTMYGYTAAAGLYGGEGNDIIYAYHGWVTGDDGDDIIYNNNISWGGRGDDIMYVSSPMMWGASFEGNEGNDTIYGNTGYDMLSGDDDDDLIYGYDGHDSLYGGNGDDVIHGGEGNDSIMSDMQLSFVIDGGGNDTIYAGNGDDWVDTGSGNDLVYGGNGNDYIYAINGYLGGFYTGVKQFYGEDGDDSLVDGAGNDFLYGGNGEDSLSVGGGGNNYASGGNDDDYISISTALSEENTAYGDDGNDTLVFLGRMGISGGAVYNYGWGTANLYGGNGNDWYNTGINETTYYNIGTNYIYDLSGSADKLWLDGALSTDTTFTVSGTDLILTFASYTGSIIVTDMFTSAHRIESLAFANYTGSLFETLTNSNNNYTATSSTSHLGLDQNFIEALAGNDIINAGVGNDFVWGGTGTDTLNGNADNDTLYGEDDNDTLRGGAGDDYLDGGSGTDTASYSTATSAVTVSLATGTSSGGDGADILVSIENLTGSGYADTLTGDGNSNQIEGGNGNDTINGGGGADYLRGGANNDTINGDAGNDWIYGNAGNDTMDGGADNDTVDYSSATAAITLNLSLTTTQVTGEGTDKVLNIENFNGSAYVDSVTGTSGANTLTGNAGNDILNGGAGNDELYGGADNDTLNGGNDSDNLYGGLGNDTMDGGSGTDYVRYNGSLTAVTVDLNAGTAMGEGSDTISNVENVEGSAYNDTLTGSSIGNTISGGGGNDLIYGGDGLDVLYGGNGSDTFTLKGETAFNNIDEIADFVNGTGGDYLDIADVLLDYGYNALTDTLSDWVAATTSGAHTLLQVDRDGTGGTYALQTIAQINNVMLNLTDITTDGNLIS